MANLVFFDVCDTLYTENTTFGFLEYYFFNHRKNLILKMRKLFVVKVLNYITIKLFDYDFVRQIGISMLRGESQENLKSYAEQYVMDRLENKKNNEIHALLSRYKNENKEIVFLSGSLDFIIEAIAKNLEVSTWFSTKLSITKGVIQGKIETDLLGNKKYIIDTYYTNRNYVLVTDNISDFNIAKGAEQSYILSKNRDLKLWQSLNNVIIIKIIT